MDDYRDAIASCCRQLRLSANLAENAFAIQAWHYSNTLLQKYLFTFQS